jgi:hypothetical protein
VLLLICLEYPDYGSPKARQMSLSKSLNAQFKLK